jgi:probable HAF family extracellular repeat protein
MTDLGALPGSDYSLAYAVNDSGQVTGSSGSASGHMHAYVYSNGAMTDLGPLGTSYLDTYGKAINAQGDVAGYGSIAGTSNQHAFLYSNGTMVDLGTLGGTVSAAWGINNFDEVVGVSETTNNASYDPFLYANGTMYDLASLLVSNPGWNTLQATAINNAGQIIGYGTSPNGRTHAFLLNPVSVPEPAPLCIVAAVMLVPMRKRREKCVSSS